MLEGLKKVGGKIKKISGSVIDEIKNMPLNKKEKELEKKLTEKTKLLKKLHDLNTEAASVADDLETIESYIKVYEDEISKIKK